MDGAPLGPLFETPPDPHYLWLLGVAAAALAIVIALYGLVRGRLPSGWSAPATMLIPIFAYVLGGITLLEESKRVSFCGSCHQTMAPIVASLAAGDDTLAAAHWQRGAVSHADACYQCHSGYGIWGTAGAKLAGVRHMMHTITGRYDLPLKSHAFDIASCLGCHAEAKPFRAEEAHHDPDLQRQLLSGEMGCAGVCHPDAHPADALNGAAPRAAAR